MEKEKLKTELLSALPAEVKEKFTPAFYALIDESIESVLDGSTTINEKVAVTDDEKRTAVMYGVMNRAQLWVETLKAARKLNSDQVTINYRGTTTVIHKTK